MAREDEPRRVMHFLPPLREGIRPLLLHPLRPHVLWRERAALGFVAAGLEAANVFLFGSGAAFYVIGDEWKIARRRADGRAVGTRRVNSVRPLHQLRVGRAHAFGFTVET